jgi:phosphodiesterase/alkaline phosphatase D-like protein
VDDDWTWTNHERTVAQIPIWDQLIRRFNKRPRIEWQIPRQRVQDALQAYWEHQGMHAPHFAWPPALDSNDQYVLTEEDTGSLAYTFTFGAAAFFVLDTRTMRIKSRSETTMLGEGQWNLLQRWFEMVKDTYPVKFLVTSCSLLFNMWLDFPRDRWSGFPVERDRLLNLIASQNIRGVYLLAGDLHTAHAIRAELYGPEDCNVPLWEFCATPFEQSPAQISSRTYWPIRKRPLKSEELAFVIRKHNFGLVRVDFSTPDSPVVIYEVYGESGEMLGEVSDR